MPTRRAPRLTVLVLGSLLLAAPALASVVMRLDLAQLTARADVVAVARVVSQESVWDGAGHIVTDVQLMVEEPVKGVTASGEIFTLRCLGGAIGDLGMRVEGEPAFRDGDRAVVFARRSPTGAHLRPVGMSQGVLPVIANAAGAPMVHPGGAGLALVTAGGALGHDVRPALASPRALPELVSELRTLAGGAR